MLYSWEVPPRGTCSSASFLQNGSLVSVACTALGDMAYVIPDVVLPLVHERFEVGEPCCLFGLRYGCVLYALCE